MRLHQNLSLTLSEAPNHFESTEQESLEPFNFDQLVFPQLSLDFGPSSIKMEVSEASRNHYEGHQQLQSQHQSYFSQESEASMDLSGLHESFMDFNGINERQASSEPPIHTFNEYTGINPPASAVTLQYSQPLDQKYMPIPDIEDHTSATYDQIPLFDSRPWPPAPPSQHIAAPIELTPPRVEKDPEEQARIEKAEADFKTLVKSTKLTDFQANLVASQNLRTSELMAAKNSQSCPKCKKVFTNKGRFAFHAQDHGITKERDKKPREFCDNSKCPHKTIGFTNRHSLLRHKSSVHGKIANFCRICLKAFSRKDGLRRHTLARCCQPNTEKSIPTEETRVCPFDLYAKKYALML